MRAPSAPLARIRWFLLLFGVFLAVTYLPQITLGSPRPVGLRSVAALSLLALVAWWVRCYRRGHFPWWGLPIEGAAFILTGLAADDPFTFIGLLYLAVTFRTLYGSVWHALTFIVVAVSCFTVAVAVQGSDYVTQFATQVPGVPVLGVLAHLAAVSLTRHERATAREQVLARSGTQVALARDRATIEHAVVEAAVALLPDVPGVRARLRLGQVPGGRQRRRDDLAGPADLTTVLPLQGKEGVLGTLEVVANRALPAEGAGSLEVLAGQVALGLENIALTEDLRRRASSDPLTGLANRPALVDHMAAALDRAAAREHVFAVLLVDLDGFKAVNDTFGHATGDALLVAVAGRLLDVARSQDTVARIGGDEFVVLLDGVTSEQGAVQVAQRILVTLSQPYALEPGEVSVGASIGITVRSTETRPDELLSEADAAMYAAKNGGKGRFAVSPAGGRAGADGGMGGAARVAPGGPVGPRTGADDEAGSARRAVVSAPR